MSTPPAENLLPDDAAIARLIVADAALARGDAVNALAESERVADAERKRYLRSVAIIADLHRANPNRPSADADSSRAHAADGASRSDPSMPDSVGRFRIECELGSGGAGVVYRAFDPELRRRVAVKLFRSADPETLARFQVELTALSSLRHPNIVQVFEQGMRDEHPYLVMEYMEGGSLWDRTARRPQANRTTARLLAALARGIHHAHAAGVIHRDLKPENVLVAADGTPKVTDFGLARRLEVEGEFTRTGAAVGTPGYMSPEQATGDSHHAGPAADVYGLGAILFEQLTGRAPFEGVIDYDVVRQVAEDEPIPVRRLNPTAAEELETICMKCLEKDPARRYPSAEALAQDLDRFLAGEPIRARPVGALIRSWRWLWHKPVPSGYLLLTGIALAAAVAVAAWALDGRERYRREAAAATEQRDAALTPAPTMRD